MNQETDKKADRKMTPKFAVGIIVCILLGPLFAFVIGDLDAPNYLLELMTIVLVEVPFAVAFAVLARKLDWPYAAIIAVTGTILAGATLWPSVNSLTPVIFLKVASTGILIGIPRLAMLSFSRHMAIAMLPGLVLGSVFGLAIVLGGVAPDVMEQTKQETLEVYQVFMSEDNAKNAVENAMYFFESIFSVAMSFFVFFALVLVWLSFYFTKVIFPKFGEHPETVPPLYMFRLPFHAVWFFLAGGILWVTGYKPGAPLALNLIGSMAGLYGLQGMAIVTYYVNGISMGRLPKVLFWLIFFLTIGFSGVFLVITGIIDNWFNIRSIPDKARDGEGQNNEDYS